MNELSNGLLRLRAMARIGRKSILGGGWACVLLLAGITAHAGSVSYAYDTLGRLAKAIYNNGTTTTTISYSYDAAGNRTAVATTSP